MASQTPNINLTLPTGAEKVSRQIINDNNTKIDTAIGTLNSNLDGLLSSASKALVTDFNNCKTAGTYKGSSGGLTSNLPTSGYFVMTVIQYSSNDLAQIAVEINNGRMFKRAFHDGTTWTSWEELASSIKSENIDTGSASKTTSLAGNHSYAFIDFVAITSSAQKSGTIIRATNTIMTHDFGSGNSVSLKIDNASTGAVTVTVSGTASWFIIGYYLG